MRILLILAHPDPASFNHALAHVVRSELRKSGHRVVWHDLYKEKFDPILGRDEIPQSGRVPPQVGRHGRDLVRAGGLVIVHPNWWGQPPAILKGWIDRVLRPGLAYRFQEGDAGEGVPEGLLKMRAALVLNTSNTSAAREKKVMRDPLATTWANCILKFCGVKKIRRKMFRVVVTSTPARRAAWLREARRLARETFG
jgi:NAD(P)H dehydrogenase (quinone)